MSEHLVFGSTGTIGSDIVDLHLERGRSVVGISRGEHDRKNENFREIKCDLSIESDVHDLANRMDDMGHIESVVFAHGAVLEGHFLTTKVDQFIDNVALNLGATIRLVHSISRIMAKQKRGSIVVIGSSVTARMQYGNLGYATSKYALKGFCKGLAFEMARFKVGVYNVAPGLIPSRLAEKATARVLGQNKGYRLTEERDVTSLVDMLIASRNLSLSGQVLYVNRQMDHL